MSRQVRAPALACSGTQPTVYCGKIQKRPASVQAGSPTPLAAADSTMQPTSASHVSVYSSRSATSTPHTVYTAATPRDSTLFYRPPHSSPDSTESPAMWEDLPPPLPSKQGNLDENRAKYTDSSWTMGSLGSGDGNDAFHASMPSHIDAGGVWRGHLDPRILADILSPRQASMSTRSRKSKSSRSSKASRKSKSSSQAAPRDDDWQDIAPPPLPPKPTAPNSASAKHQSLRSHHSAYSTHSSMSATTETQVHPSVAQRATRHNALHLTNTSLSSFAKLAAAQNQPAVGPDETQGPGISLALADLPWAGPPSRLSPLATPAQSPIMPSPLLPRSNAPFSGRQPSYSFLSEDPVVSLSIGNHSRRSSTSSGHGKRPNPINILGSATGHDALPSGVPVSPSILPHTPTHDHRFSAWSAYSGMAVTSDETPTDEVSREYLQTSSNGLYLDLDSAAATLGSSSMRWHGQPSLAPSKSTTSSKSQCSRSKSSHSAKSSRYKRGSNSTIGHVFNKYWEVRRNGEIDDVEVEKELQREVWRLKEEGMDLGALVGRAVVLEGMLRGGKRLSQQSIKRGYKISRFSISTTRNTPISTPSTKNTPLPTISHGFSPSFSQIVASLTNNLSHSYTSSDVQPGRKSGSTTYSRSKSRANRSSTPASLRWRLSQKLKRSKSREDVFTELDSESEAESDPDDPSLFPDHVQAARPSSKRSSAKILHLSGRPLTHDQETPAAGVEEEKRTDRVGGICVLVFPEEAEVGPPTPPKDAQRTPHHSKSSRSLLGFSSTCISPTSPTAILENISSVFPRTGPQSDNDLEKGLTQECMTKTEQSPHLGHRPLNWTQRLSILSYVSTSAWDPVVASPEGRKRRRYIVIGVGMGVVVIAIIGLLSGLLSERTTDE